MERVHLSHADLKQFTAHRAKQNEDAARKTVANIGKASGEGMPSGGPATSTHAAHAPNGTGVKGGSRTDLAHKIASCGDGM